MPQMKQHREWYKRNAWGARHHKLPGLPRVRASPGIAGAHRFLLQRLAPAEPVFAEQQGDDVTTDRRAHRGEAISDLPPREVGPLHLGPHRIAGGVVLKDLEEVRFEGVGDLD